tara:strand:- start:39173 stop:39724 length:552 start_codon:yes stop_codon:yes gene_type:complete
MLSSNSRAHRNYGFAVKAGKEMANLFSELLQERVEKMEYQRYSMEREHGDLLSIISKLHNLDSEPDQGLYLWLMWRISDGWEERGDEYSHCVRNLAFAVLEEWTNHHGHCVIWASVSEVAEQLSNTAQCTSCTDMAKDMLLAAAESYRDDSLSQSSQRLEMAYRTRKATQAFAEWKATVTRDL